MKSHISDYRYVPFSSAQRKKLKEQEERERNQRNSEVLKIVLIMFCYVLHKRYRFTPKTLQSIINETYQLIYDAKNSGVDWTVGVNFWANRRGLKL